MTMNTKQIKSIHIKERTLSTSNSHAFVTVNYTDGSEQVFTGKAFGYGYCKQSSSIAGALNRCPELMRDLTASFNKRLEIGDFSDPMRDPICQKVLGYGAGYGDKPYFEGGVGVRCLIDILKSLYPLTNRDSYRGKNNSYIETYMFHSLPSLIKSTHTQNAAA